MEEELSENELEERFYSMLHYVDNTQTNVTTTQDALKIIENAPRSTLRRYWWTSGDHTATTQLNTPFQKINTPSQKINTPYQKVNTPSQNNTSQKINTPTTPKEVQKPSTEDLKPKEEKTITVPEPLPKHLSLFNSPVPKDFEKSIEIIENDDSNIVELDSSDEDEVIEVALPPKPTITIESSDDEISIQTSPTKAKRAKVHEKGARNGEREISASPVPSIVSSVSDDFIRGDCIAFNISSRRPDNPSFDFSLHGADILGSTPSKKKRRKKNKESATSTPVIAVPTQNKPIVVEECFATPKSKAKNKKQKNKSYLVTEKSIPNADVYDSDSNQSIIEPNKNQHTYIVTEKSMPCADVYETDSNPSDARRPGKPTKVLSPNSSDSSISTDKSCENISKTKADTIPITEVTIDLTKNAPTNVHIQENIVMGNVTGFTECDEYEEPITVEQTSEPIFGSTKVPAILYENLDFDNLKGKEKVCKNKRYSLSTLRAEMEKFYNESWGGENFNHREIQKNMSRDKTLWAIDPKDRMGSYTRKRYNVTCNYCNQPGHRDDTCRLKPPVCFMCGITGHMEPRCPRKICVNCGSPNYLYSTQCRACSGWARVRCAECGQSGHPDTHCPDLWRRYHNTLDTTSFLEENCFTKKPYQLFCSGCTRRGHLIHTCRISLPFSGLPINSPYVHVYKPVYSALPNPNVPNEYQNNQRNKPQIKNFQDSTISSATTPSRNVPNKRQSKSPTVHETHVNKKRMVSVSDITEGNATIPTHEEPQRKRSESKEAVEESQNVLKQQDKSSDAQTFETMEKAPDYIPISSNNHDKQGQVIQDNEVSDTSDAITSARIYVTTDIIEKLKSKDAADWLKETTEKMHVSIEITDSLFVTIKGKVADQEMFQFALKNWTKETSNTEQTKQVYEPDTAQQSENNQPLLSDNIPKNRNTVLRKIKTALESLKKSIGDPNTLYKDYISLQIRHEKLLKQKVISSEQLGQNRNHINATLRKLNMIFLGQAGLADGEEHIKELHTLQQKLINQRTNKVSAQTRQDVGKHFHSIFTGVPRFDYGLLLQSYNRQTVTKPSQKNKKKSFIKKSKPEKFDTIPVQKQNNINKNNKNNFKTGNEKSKNQIAQNPTNNRQNLAKSVLNKMVFYYRRLMSAHPTDSVLKKTRVELVRKLHSSIGSLSMNTNTTSKNLKKMRKIQEQAQLFLNNV